MLKRIVSFILAAMLLTSVAFAANFTDFGAEHWAYQYVDKLVNNGVINGYEDGSYRPEANVTRAELAKLISVQFGSFADKTYVDVVQGDWFYGYVMAASGYFLAGDNFYPNTPATREEVAYAIYMAKQLNQTGASVAFTDAADISASYQAAVAAVANSGIITGYPDGTFGPKNNITRAEVATVLCRAIDLDTNEALYQEMFNMAKLTEFSYAAQRRLSYGELASAALRMYNNEYELAYYNLGDVAGKRPFQHKDALSLWIIGRDVLGANIVSEAIIDTPITVGEAKKVLVYYAQLHDIKQRTIDQTKLLAGVSDSMSLSCYRFAQLITEIDEQIPMLVKIVVTGGATADQIPTALRKDLESLPANRSKYQAILEEVPNAVYEESYALTTDALSGSYDFAREMKSFLLGPINQFCQIAKAKGAELNIHYYPSLVVGKDNVFTMRVKVEVVSVKSGLSLNDVCKASVDRPLKAGDTFFCDLNTNVKVPSTKLSGEALSIDNIIE